MITLANLPPPTAEQFWPVLVSAFAILGIISQVLGIVRHFSGTKVSGHMLTKEAGEPATKAELEVLRREANKRAEVITQRFDMLKDELRALPMALMKQVSESLRDVIQRLNDQGEDIAGLKAVNERRPRK